MVGCWCPVLPRGPFGHVITQEKFNNLDTICTVLMYVRNYRCSSWSVGTSESTGVGGRLGTGVGCKIGTSVGTGDGWRDGTGVGAKEGRKLGTGEGWRLGTGDGCSVVTSDGTGVGCCVGTGEGMSEACSSRGSLKSKRLAAGNRS